MAYRNRNKPLNGKMSDSRIAWTSNAIGTFELRQHLPDLEEEDNESLIGFNIRLGITRPGAYKPASFNLTALTLAEMTALRNFLDFVFDLAEPVVKQRDQVAEDAKAKGDDSYARSYRRLPQVVTRESKIFTYSEGVLYGPDGLPARTGAGGGQPDDPDRGGAGGSGDGLADEESSGPSSEDHEPEVDQP